MSAILLAMHQQLNGIARQNTTLLPPLVPDPNTTFRAPPHAVQANICWYLSLIISLATVAIGILCLQWLREHRRDSNASTNIVFFFRGVRISALTRWGVPGIIGMLPMLLLTSLFLFLAGLVLSLWILNKSVAISVSAATGVILVILLGTSILPAVHPGCAFRSPQAWFLLAAREVVQRLLDRAARSDSAKTFFRFLFQKFPRLSPWCSPRLALCLVDRDQEPSLSHKDWISVDESMVMESCSQSSNTHSFHRWEWFTTTFSQDKDAIIAFLHCVKLQGVTASKMGINVVMVHEMICLLGATRPFWAQHREDLHSDVNSRLTPLAAQKDIDLELTLCIRYAVNIQPSLLPEFFNYLLDCHMRLMGLGSAAFSDKLATCLIENFIRDISRSGWPQLPAIAQDAAIHDIVQKVPQGEPLKRSA